MAIEFIGRKLEKKILKEAIESNEAEMVAVIGRRRIGKTFLVTTSYEKEIVFEMSGLQDVSLEGQLKNFAAQLTKVVNPTFPIKSPTDWLEAFQLLINYLSPLMGEDKKVVFFDELPWLASPKSKFLSALGYFWNSWASRENIVVVICGSAASWMIQKVVHHKGGLHNRITKRIYLQPFTLAETEKYLKSRHIHFDRYQIIHLYMAIGGIPHYLKEVRASRSVIQNIDYLCFSKSGILTDEFSKLYPSLFEQADKHIAVVRALAKKRKGLLRKEIIETAKITNGGGTTSVLKELEQSGFISSYHPFGKRKKDKLYRLTDEYSLFYLQFIENRINGGPGTWQHLSQQPAYKSWSGYAFESICMKHLLQIKKALGIANVYTIPYSFNKQGTKEEQGAQIDMLLDRADAVINLIEIKFHKDVYTVSKAYAKQLIEKRSIFKQATKSKKHLSWALITASGFKQNQYSLGLIENHIEMDALFEDISLDY
jgi:AAA+ ATPase superfamily predicted ATPase